MNNDEKSSHKLDGQIAVVTGAAQGLGLGIANQLAQDGACVVIADIQMAKAQNAAKELRGMNLEVDAAYLDITDSAAVNEFFIEIVARYGRIDILINNAGTGQTVTPIVDLSDLEWGRVLNVNLTGTFYCCRAAATIMQQQESGCIVNIASINGQNPGTHVVSYNVSKAGVIMLTKTLSLEMAAYGVRVNAVCPGPVYTDFNVSIMKQRSEKLHITEREMIERIRTAIPMGRWGEPNDIAQGVAFLCSHEASWITGEVLRISGGLEGVSAAPPKQPKSKVP
jgi:3-oxoacyl-[acyl-carrier protein] reductase